MNEIQLQKQVCDYIHWAYPRAMFNSDLAGIKLTIGQAVRAKTLKSERGFPDLFIYEKNNDHIGLCIELKVEGTSIFKKNGEFATPHIKEQAEVLRKLSQRGFYAVFGIGFDHAKKIIDDYFKKK